MVETTSPISPSEAGWGAGQLAALLNGLALVDHFTHWGTPRHPKEPVSIAIANVQRNIDHIVKTLQALDGLDDVAADALRARLEAEWETCWDYLFNTPQPKPGDDTTARTAEEYESLANAQNVRPGPAIDYAELKRRVDITEYAMRYTSLRKSGRGLKGKCPLPGHDDDTASFFIYPANASFYCYGCNRWGDVIDLARLMRAQVA